MDERTSGDFRENSNPIMHSFFFRHRESPLIGVQNCTQDKVHCLLIQRPVLLIDTFVLFLSACLVCPLVSLFLSVYPNVCLS